jgi:hypothetical protein
VPEPIKTRTNVIWLEGDILRGRENVGSETHLPDAKGLVDSITKLSPGVRRPIVMDISGAKSVTREARAYFAGDEMAAAVSALALVVGSALSRAIGSFFLTFHRPKFAVKLFTTVEDATAWARNYIEG